METFKNGDDGVNCCSYRTSQPGKVQRSNLFWHNSLIKVVFLIGLFLSTAFVAEASHFRYGSISWQKINNSTNQVKFKVSVAFRRWANQQVGQSVNVGSLQFGDGSSANISVTVTSAQGNSSTGWFFGEAEITKTYGANGNYNARWRSCCRIGGLGNGGAYWDVQTIVNIGNNNNSPVTSVPPIVAVQTGQSNAQFQVPFTDPDGDNLSYRLATYNEMGNSNNPSGLSVNPSTGVVSWNTVGKPVGQLWAVGIVGEDGQSKTMADFLIQIVQTSTPPVFDYSVTPASGTIYQVSPGQNVNFTVKASDTDAGSTVSLNAVGNPPGSSFSPSLPTSGSNPSQTTFNWTPGVGDLGTSVINFVATDNIGVQTSTNVSIIVSLKPVFDVGPTPQELVHLVYQPGATISFPVQASDPDVNDLVQIIAANGKDMGGNLIPLYPGASFGPLPSPAGNPTSGNFSWNTTASDWGHKHVVFTAEDSYGDQAKHEIAILLNTQPTFTSTPVVEANRGQAYSYQVVATDPDLIHGDSIKLYAPGLPAWLSFVDNGDGTGTLSGTPGAADVGTLQINLEAQDLNHHQGGTAIQSFTLVVNNCVIDARCKDVTLYLDQNGAASLSASDIDDGSSVTCGPMQLSISKSAFSCDDIGSNQVLLFVTDNTGNMDSCLATVIVHDEIPPTVTCHTNISTSTDPGACHSVQLKKEILHYDPVGYQTSASHVLPASTSSGVTGGPLFGVGYPNQYNYHVKPVGPVSQSSTVDVSQYVEFTVSLNEFTALASLAFQKYSYFQQGGTVSSIRSSVDGFASDIDQIATNPAFGQILEYDLSSLGTVKGSITFRLYFWGGSGDWMDIVSSYYGGIGVKLYKIDLGLFSDNCEIVDLTYAGLPAKCEFPLGSTTVSVTAIDASGNSSSCEIVVEVADVEAPSISCPADISIVAQRDDCDPQIFWEEPVASDNCSVSVSSSHASGDEFPVGSTTVTYTATDPSGNSTSCSFVVTVTPEPLIQSGVLSLFEGGFNISCFGAADGSIDLTVEGGCLPYSFDWSHGASTEDVSGLIAGSYGVVITDANGTSISASYTLSEPTPLSLSVSDNQTVYLGYDPAACADIGLSISGGVAPYSYAWSNGFDGTDQQVCPEISTEYVVTVTDANGCEISDAIMVCVIDIRSRDKKGNIKPGKVDICHVPPGNPANAHTISISVNAVADHLAEHDDYLGACGTNPTCLDDGLAEAYVPPTASDDDGGSAGSGGKGKGRKSGDFEETTSISGVLEELSVFPNPFKAELNVSVGVALNEQIEIALMDLSGKQIKTLFNGNSTSKHIHLKISAEDLSAGVYMLIVKSQGSVKMERIVKH
ncbi:HYR domain-containing protein [Luteibaculum oceani]|uniref:HYR domain-containing protein n=1 Tax=Luteibaculum oceani TaxID=1294296 RepID=A0A5C6V2V9_9FLAO|nr:HYR domain-containing protein [Luteibaculum oceani]TXC78816.1 HYR domain-containing protein [Luteibaculum oceani]